MTETKKPSGNGIIIKSHSVHTNGVLTIIEETAFVQKILIDIKLLRDKINIPLRLKDGIIVIKSANDAGSCIEISVTYLMISDSCETLSGGSND